LKTKELFQDLQNGNRRALAKAITLIESSKKEDKDAARELMSLVIPNSGKSKRVAISGIPGVGKSSFIETFGNKLIEDGNRVAVLAIDPSSPISGGSILGDKTRMETLSQKSEAFIRPSPTSGSLGGVANKTRETILLCEAAGFNFIILETVGVGQSEYMAASMVDFFMVLMVPNAGDEIQGIKKGIIELADLLVINKADGDTLALAENAKTQYENALNIVKRDSSWNTSVLTCSALFNKGLDEIYNSINNFYNKCSKEITEKRKSQNLKWLQALFDEKLKDKLENSSTIKSQYDKIKKEVSKEKISPESGAEKMINLLFKD